MANFDNVQVSLLSENGQFQPISETTHELVVKAPAENIVLSFGSDKVKPIEINNDTETSRMGKQSLIITNNQTTHCIQFTSVHALKSFQHHLKQQKNKKLSVFTERTDEASAVQYFQFYGYLSQQQNMMQDYIRTSTYQQAMLSNLSDFTDKIVLDVGAGSGILSFFAVQSGAKKVYAIEASSMAQHNLITEICHYTKHRPLS